MTSFMEFRLEIYLCYFKFSDEIVALKKLKMEKEKEGFPITSLREINTLLKAQHVNIVTVRVSMIKLLNNFLYYTVTSVFRGT